MAEGKPTEDEIRNAVKERYGALARRGGGGCCSRDAAPRVELVAGDAIPDGMGYSDDELAALPSGAREVSAGCGNPLALAGVRPGDVVVDLGSGGGIDVFLAAKRVGPSGRALGVDATPEMVWRARRAAQEHGVANVEFRLGEIEHLPVESGTADLLISNCVINLSPDKDQVFREAFRVLKPGGKLAVSDIVTLRDLPDDVRCDLGKWSSCISGAISEEEYLERLRRAGFVDVEVAQRHVYEDGQARAIVEGLGDSACGCGTGVRSPTYLKKLVDSGLFGALASDKITARKPG